MRPKWHILFGFVFSYVLLYFFNFPLIAGIVIFLSSFLIDVDHYFLYLYKTGNFSPRGSYFWCIEEGEKFEKLPIKERKKYKLEIMVFHGLEFILILILLSFISKVFLWVLFGILIHMVADLLDLYFRNWPIHEKVSQLYTYQKNKKKKELK